MQRLEKFGILAVMKSIHGNREGRILFLPDPSAIKSTSGVTVGNHEAVVLPGSQFWKPQVGEQWGDRDKWIEDEINNFEKSRDVHDDTTHYTVVNPLKGTVNGIAAAINGGNPGNGYVRFKTYDGKTLHELGYQGRASQESEE